MVRQISYPSKKGSHFGNPMTPDQEHKFTEDLKNAIRHMYNKEHDEFRPKRSYQRSIRHSRAKWCNKDSVRPRVLYNTKRLKIIQLMYGKVGSF